MSNEPILCPKCKSILQLREKSIKNGNVTQVKIEIICPNCGYILPQDESRIIREPAIKRTDVFITELLRPITFSCKCGYMEIIQRLPWQCPRCKGTLTFIPANTMRTSEKKSK